MVDFNSLIPGKIVLSITRFQHGSASDKTYGIVVKKTEKTVKFLTILFNRVGEVTGTKEVRYETVIFGKEPAWTTSSWTNHYFHRGNMVTNRSDIHAIIRNLFTFEDYK
jgi:hypothetical protein